MAASDDTASMALFCDFENVALGVRDAQYEKFDIRPVLERLLASSGRLVMSTPQETHPIIIEHVLGISTKDDQISRLLGVRRVVTESAG